MNKFVFILGVNRGASRSSRVINIGSRGRRVTRSRGASQSVVQRQVVASLEHVAQQVPNENDDRIQVEGQSALSAVTPESRNELVSRRIAILGAALSEKLEKSQEVFQSNVYKSLSRFESKHQIRLERPYFRSEFNRKLYEREITYSNFITDAIFFLEAGQTDDARACLDAHKAALEKFLSEVKLADSSEAGWTLIDRIKYSPPGANVATLEAAILEERRLYNN